MRIGGGIFKPVLKHLDSLKIHFSHFAKEEHLVKKL